MSRARIGIRFSIPNLETAGSRQVLYNLVVGLDREVFDPSVVVLERRGSMVEKLSGEGIPVIEAPFAIEARPYATLPLRLTKAAGALRRAEVGPRPAIQHSFHYRDDYTEPLIARLAGAGRWIYTKKAMGWGSRGWRIRSRLAGRIIVDNSEMIDRMFAPLGLERRCRLVHHGVVPEFFEAPSTAERVYRARLGIGPDEKLVVSVADLVPIKGHVDLIQALAALGDHHLALAGGGTRQPHAAALTELCHTLGCQDRVHFLGRIDDVPTLLCEADLFVLASRPPGEGCPVALLEAMAAGVACIATDVPGCREVLDSPDVGCLVPPGEPAALAEAVAKLLAAPELRATLSLAARRRVLTEFTVEREVAELSRIYAELSK